MRSDDALTAGLSVKRSGVVASVGTRNQQRRLRFWVEQFRDEEKFPIDLSTIHVVARELGALSEYNNVEIDTDAQPT